MLAASYSNSITLGAVLIGVLVAGGIAYLRIRAGTEAGAAAVWESVAKGHEERAALLHQQLRECSDLVGDQKKTIERLEALPNLERIINLMAQTAQNQDIHAQERVAGVMAQFEQIQDNHESRAAQRHDAQMLVLQQMQATQQEMYRVFRKLNGH